MLWVFVTFLECAFQVEIYLMSFPTCVVTSLKNIIILSTLLSGGLYRWFIFNEFSHLCGYLTKKHHHPVDIAFRWVVFNEFSHLRGYSTKITIILLYAQCWYCFQVAYIDGLYLMSFPTCVVIPLKSTILLAHAHLHYTTLLY